MQTYQMQNCIINIMLANEECKQKQNSFCNKVITPLATIATIENTRYLTTYCSSCCYCMLYTTNIYVLSLDEQHSYNNYKISLIRAKVYSHYFIRYLYYVLYIVKKQQQQYIYLLRLILSHIVGMCIEISSLCLSLQDIVAMMSYYA